MVFLFKSFITESLDDVRCSSLSLSLSFPTSFVVCLSLSFVCLLSVSSVCYIFVYYICWQLSSSFFWPLTSILWFKFVLLHSVFTTWILFVFVFAEVQVLLLLLVLSFLLFARCGDRVRCWLSLSLISFLYTGFMKFLLQGNYWMVIYTFQRM